MDLFSFFHPENRGSRLLRNIGTYLPNLMASHPEHHNFEKIYKNLSL
jgi:hypothetical protein